MKTHLDLRRSRRITVKEGKHIVFLICNNPAYKGLSKKLKAAISEAEAPLTAQAKRLAKMRADNFKEALAKPRPVVRCNPHRNHATIPFPRDPRRSETP